MSLGAVIGQSSSAWIDVCVGSAVCDAATVSVNQMDSVFNGLPGSAQAQFQSMHDSIMQAYQKNQPSFYIDCCALQTVGQNADALTNQMLSATGQAPLANPSGGPTFDWQTVAMVAVVGIIGIVALQQL